MTRRTAAWSLGTVLSNVVSAIFDAEDLGSRVERGNEYTFVICIAIFPITEQTVSRSLALQLIWNTTL